MATTWNNLGLAWHSKGEYDKAIAYYEISLAVFETVLGKNHPNMKTVRNNLNRARVSAFPMKDSPGT
ncbi:MAG: tetratricopeptide repeat protein [Desulfobacterales bacterium]|nr:tetratricopeptide repeat protein [Desulfobacterales bacterium]